MDDPSGPGPVPKQPPKLIAGTSTDSIHGTRAALVHRTPHAQAHARQAFARSLAPGDSSPTDQTATGTGTPTMGAAERDLYDTVYAQSSNSRIVSNFFNPLW